MTAACMPVVEMCQTYRYSMDPCSFLTQHTVLPQEQLSLLSMVARVDHQITNSQFRVRMGDDALQARNVLVECVILLALF